jgi:hypothetical protein
MCWAISLFQNQLLNTGIESSQETENGLKKHLRGRNFHSPEDIDQEVFEYFDSIAKEEWRLVFDQWIHRMKRCIEVKGDYFEQL